MTVSNTRERGFTLIELLVVVAIIGILAAIGLQIFVEFRKRAFDARAEEDLRNLAGAEEAYFVTAETFKSCVGPVDCASALPGVHAISPGVDLAITATTSGFTGSSTHPQGSGLTYRWDSRNGGMQ